MDVTIRPLQEEDAYTSVKWRNDPDVFKYTGNVYDHVITIDSELDWIRKVIASPNDFRCAILADNNYVGNIYLHDIDYDERSAVYAIFIGEKSYWGKGVAQKASLLIIEYGFKELRLKTISLKVRKSNERAIMLYNKLGFIKVEENVEWEVMVITPQSLSSIK